MTTDSSTPQSLNFAFFNLIFFFEEFEMLLIEKKENVAIVTLNRPKALNALCDQLLKELGVALTNLKQDNEVRAVILTGSKKAFAGI